MNNYNFATLNDKEFEQIAKDLLNAKFHFGLQSFKVGKDQGVDLRFSSAENNNALVVQAKHYVCSSFSQLKSTLIKKELNKVVKLQPNRYIVVTSLSLSAFQKDVIKKSLSPFILSSNDVIGQEDLNGYLSEFREIEKKYFKLWFSSTNVFKAILNNAIEGRTKYTLEKISNKISFYVVTKKLDEANEILKKEKILLVTGQPGIGKTTLAEIILLEKAKNGYKVYEVQNILEAEEIVSSNTEEKQIFYFDDFLGSNYYEIINAQKTETQLTSFVERVRNTPNKYMILTTRTIILNYAIENYEKIGRSKLKSEAFELKLVDYNQYEKALILYNHLYFRNVRNEIKDIILNEKFYRKIISHKNYTPRIIEFITDNSIIVNLNPQEYLQFVTNNLNNPKEIWRYSFVNQIDYLDRCLLLTLFTFENAPFERQLSQAFQYRLEFEKKEHNQIINSEQFDKSIKILLNGFIVSYLHGTKIPIRQFSFINPSLTDFLIGYVADSFLERRSIVSSLIYVEQLNRFNPNKAIIPFEKELQLILREKIIRSELLIYEEKYKNFSKNKRYATLLEILIIYCNEVNVDSLLLENFKMISYSENWIEILPKIEIFLSKLGDAPQTFSFIKENFLVIIEKVMATVNDAELITRIPSIFRKYHHDYEEYAKSSTGFDDLVEAVSEILSKKQEDFKREHTSRVKDMDDIDFLYEDIFSMEKQLKNCLFPSYSIVNYDFGVFVDKDYWRGVIQENIMEAEEKNILDEDNETYYNDEPWEETDREDEAIDDLFIKLE